MLPKPTKPEYNTVIPSTGKKIKYQPFTVKEEKLLILAAESQDQDEITNAIINVIQSCVTSPSDIDVEELALFDIEYLFLKARAKSIGEKIDLMVTDPNDPEYTVNHSINIDKIGIEKTPGHTDVITISDTMTLKMRYPDISFFNEGINMSTVTSSLKTVGRCVSSLVVDDEVFNRSDMQEGEIEEWLESLTNSKFKKITEFFETMPKLRYKFTLKNERTGNDFEIVLEDLADFF
jgi:hypothetical protein